jgi:OmpA-OmpF porin, OOP family
MKNSTGVVAFAVVLLGVAGAAVVANFVDRSAAEQVRKPHAVLVTGSSNRLDSELIADTTSKGSGLEKTLPDETSQLERPVLGASSSEAESIDVSPEADSAAVVAPPLTNLLSIRRNGDRIELAGAVARVEDTDELVAAARQAFPTFAIDTTLVQEPNIADNRLPVALLAVAALSRLAEGRAAIEGNDMTITGRALYAQTPELLAARLEKATPEGWTVSLDVDAPERIAANGGAQCQQRIVERLADDQISFAVAAATLAPDAEPLIDELAEILGECPDVAVEVAGHTDSDGSEAANRRLSQERAAAVRQALSARGVENDRLSAVGYGQAQPIAPNDTPENKARNRRIELIVIE